MNILKGQCTKQSIWRCGRLCSDYWGHMTCVLNSSNKVFHISFSSWEVMLRNMAIARHVMTTWRSFGGGFDTLVGLNAGLTSTRFHWPLAADKLHFDVACLPELAEYWKHLLIGTKIELKEAPVKRKRYFDEQPGDERFGKRVRTPRESWDVRTLFPSMEGLDLGVATSGVFLDFPNAVGRKFGVLFTASVSAHPDFWSKIRMSRYRCST